MTRAIMLQGTGSDVGKSLLVAALGRAFTRRGLSVRPFKPQNMSNNAAVTADGGEAITVAQVASNDIVGEIAILCDVPRTASVVATSELTTLKITKELFFRMVQDFPQIGVEVMRVLAHRLETTTRQLRAARGG